MRGILRRQDEVKKIVKSQGRQNHRNVIKLKDKLSKTVVKKSMEICKIINETERDKECKTKLSLDLTKIKIKLTDKNCL